MEEILKSYIQNKDDDAVVHISEVEKYQGGYSKPFSIGYKLFDEALEGGVRAGDLVVITGLSEGGKTTLAQSLSVNLSNEMLPSLWFSYEVILSNLAARFKSMGMNDKNFLIYVPKRNTSGNLKWIKNKIVESYEKFKTKFIFIDHLDHLSPTNIRSSDQKRMIIGNICQELKDIAIEMEMIIFLIIHVTKIPNHRQIEMQDLGESSKTYQIPDSIFCITRQTEIRMEDGKKVEVQENRSIIRMLKNRLTGIKPKLDVVLENNVFVPLSEEKKEEDLMRSILK
jgi:replicative DNA helicase